MENEFPSNSRASKAAPTEKPGEKKVEAVVRSEVIRRKKPLGKRFFETFIGGDARTVVSYIVSEVLLPAAKDMISDAVGQGIDRMLFGESRSSRRSVSRSSSGYTSYNRYSSPTTSSTPPWRKEESRPVSARARKTHDFDEVILATRVEAEEVVDRLYHLLERYGSVTVSDLYALIDVTAHYTDEKYGWTDLRGAGVRHIHGGYLLDLPRPEPLN